MTEYVVGFLFADRTHVALLRKSHPEWQRGKLNGIGGKINVGENVLDAMVREFREETGYQTALADWSPQIRLTGTDFICHVLAAFYGNAVAIKGDGDEPCDWYDHRNLPVMDDIIPNLRWIVPFCLDHGPAKSLVVNYPRPNGRNNPGPTPQTPSEEPK